MILRIFPLVGLLAFLLPAELLTQVQAEPVDFARDVLPVLSEHCFECHGPDPKARKRGLRLDTKEGAFRTNRKGKTMIVPGKSAQSEVIRRITSKDLDEVMPPPEAKRKLTPAQIDLLKRWVDEGAEWGKHWAFTVPVRPRVPTLPNQSWTHNPIDAFVLARKRAEGLPPSPEASREQLIRRVSLDLTGLPPTLAEVDAFLADRGPGAYERVVDRLLASPRYGERMAWDWLDAARYADSNGYQGDSERTMWPWRDWVVRALNENMPYDQFTIEQLAGDLLPGATQEQILATAFNRNHMINGEGGRIPEENRVEYLFDQTETMATIWMGVTFTCARCHDHKFDPFTRKEYYQLLAYFNRTPVDGRGRSGQMPPVISFASPKQEQQLAQLSKQVRALTARVKKKEAALRKAGMVLKDGKYTTTLPQIIESSLRKGPNDRARQNWTALAKFYAKSEPAYVRELKQLQKLKRDQSAAARAMPKVMIMQDMARPRPTYILTRGTYNKREDKVEASVPSGLLALPASAPKNRLALARWLMDKENPLTARVTVNRAWQLFFGTGLVKTAEDFGVRGGRPSHPDLLDWLAVEFRDGGWNVKHLHRLIVTSATYRQSARVTPKLLERDPENRLLTRGSRSRLPSWMIRDQALAVSGLLGTTLGGPPVKPYQPAGIWEEATFGKKSYRQDKGKALYRRSLYVFWRRIIGPTMFFDSANRQTCTVNNVITNTPLHALTTLNDTTYVEAARMLAQRAFHEAKNSDEDRLTLAFRLVTARRPTTTQLSILRGALKRQRRLFAGKPDRARQLVTVGDAPRDEKIDVVEHAALTAVCSMLLNLDETLTR